MYEFKTSTNIFGEKYLFISGCDPSLIPVLWIQFALLFDECYHGGNGVKHHFSSGVYFSENSLPRGREMMVGEKMKGKKKGKQEETRRKKE